MARDSSTFKQEEEADKERKILAALQFLADHGAYRTAGIANFVYLPPEKIKKLTRDELSILTTATNELDRVMGKSNSFAIIRETTDPRSAIAEVRCSADQFFQWSIPKGITFNSNIAPFIPSVPEASASTTLSEIDQERDIPTKLSADDRKGRIRTALGIIHWVGVPATRKIGTKKMEIIRIPITNEDSIKDIIALNGLYRQGFVTGREGKVNPKSLQEQDRHYEISKDAYLLCCRLVGYSPQERLAPDAKGATDHRFL